MQPVDVQVREDAELGAAWRRAEAAAGEDTITLSSWHDGERRWCTAETQDLIPSHDDETPAAALTALAEALESRKAER